MLFAFDKKIEFEEQLFDNYYFTENADKKEVRKIDFDKFDKFKIRNDKDEIILDEFGIPKTNSIEEKPLLYNNINDSSIISILKKSGEIYKWSYDGKLLAYNQFPFELGYNNKFSKSGKYLACIKFNYYDDMNDKFIIISLKDLKSVFLMDTTLYKAGIVFIENDSVLAYLYKPNFIYSIDYYYKLKPIHNINLNTSYNRNGDIMQLEDSIIIGKSDSSFVVYNFINKTTKQLFFEKNDNTSVGTRRYLQRLFNYNQIHNLYFESTWFSDSLKIYDKDLKLLYNSKVNGVFKIDNLFYINNFLLINTFKVNSYFTGSTDLKLRQLPQLYIEGYNLQ